MVGICPGGICPAGICPGGICPGGICPAGICPDTVIYICCVDFASLDVVCDELNDCVWKFWSIAAF